MGSGVLGGGGGQMFGSFQVYFCLGLGLRDIYGHFDVYIFMRVLMVGFGIFRSIILVMKCSCMALLTPIMMVMRGLVFHPFACMVLIGGSYLVCLCVRACSGYMSWQYVNSMSWIVSVGEGDIGVYVGFGAPIMHMISCSNFAWHWHVICEHVH